ncbi:MAG: type I polyketide synthase [Marinibacterium sp.]
MTDASRSGPDTGASEPIAIVGMGCVFPEAADLTAYWRNILGKVDAVGDAPADWCADLVFDPDSTDNDRTYTNRGGFLRDLARFDPLRHGVMPNSVDGGEPDQFLALEIAADAVADANYDQRPVPGDRVAVILGRGTYINRGFVNVLQHGIMVDRFLACLRRLHPDTTDAEAAELKADLKASLPPFNSEMAPALVPNLVTGRISNRLDFRGTNYIIDAACASSLIALERGVADLRAGSCDMALVGGVHASTPAPIYQIFSQLGALSHKGNIRPFSQEADGTLLAEGVGILCIKRLSDAEAAGDRIYALVRGVGVASDGKGMSILAPRLDGERMAIRRAYEAADVAPQSVGLIEAHGTATSVGDATEIEALTEEFGDGATSCALGAVKSMIGHCLPASGSAGLIKVAMALHHRVLPPTLVDTPNPDLGLEGTGFYLNTEARPWIHGRSTPRRAGVNAFGFGGINAHVVLEEYTGGGQPRPMARRDSELLVLDASDKESALARLDQLESRLATQSLSDLARALHAEASRGRLRLAIVAQTADEVRERIGLLRQGLEKGRARLRDRRGAYFSSEPLAEDGKVAFLYPGEGSQYRNMLLPHMLHFPQMRLWFDIVDGAYAEGANRKLPSEVFFPPPLAAPEDSDQWRMDVGPEAIFAANMAVTELYCQIGLRPDMLVGHSTGEYAALNAAGATARDTSAALQADIRALNTVFATAEAAGAITEGTLFTIGPINADKLRARLTERDDVFLGMDNCPGQQVLAAITDEGAEWVRHTARELGGYCEALPFTRAYHCPAFRPFSEALGGFLSGVDIRPPVLPVYSCITTEPFPEDPDQVRRMMADQWSSEVRFTDTITRMYDDGARIFVECGPRNNLTSFVSDILRRRKHLAVAADTTARTGLEQVHHLAAQLYAEGVDFDIAALMPVEDAPRGSANAQPLKMGLQPMTLSDKIRPRPASAASTSAGPATAPSGPDPVPADPMADLAGSYFATMQKMMETEQQVMAAYLGGGSPAPAPTVPAAAQGARFPMLSDIAADAGGQSLTARMVVDHARASYLTDHSFGRATSINQPDRHGVSVVPLTFTMEALAEAAAALRPGLQVTALREVRGSRWIKVEKPETVTLEVTAEIVDEAAETVVRVRIRDAEGPKLRPVIAECEVVLAAARTAPPPAPAFAPTGATRPEGWDQDGVYRRIMFHGPRLQGVESLDLVAPDAAEGGLIGLPHDSLFTGQPDPVFETDAITLDAIGQLVGVWSADQLAEAFHIFPFRVESVEIFRDRLAPGERARCRCNIDLIGARDMRSDIDIVTGDGHLLARIAGWWDKRFDLPEPFFAARLDPARNALSRALPRDEALPGMRMTIADTLSNDLLDGSGGIWAAVLGGLILSDAETAEWQAITGPERFDWIRARAAAKDAVRLWRGTELYPADITLKALPGGIMEIAAGWPADWGAPPRIAVAHTNETAFAIAADAERYAKVGLAAEAAGQDARALAEQAAANILGRADGLTAAETGNDPKIVTISQGAGGNKATAHLRDSTGHIIAIAIQV